MARINRYRTRRTLYAWLSLSPPLASLGMCGAGAEILIKQAFNLEKHRAGHGPQMWRWKLSEEGERMVQMGSTTESLVCLGKRQVKRLSKKTVHKRRIEMMPCDNISNTSGEIRAALLKMIVYDLVIAPGEEIRSAYLKLAKKLHPDVSKDADDIAR